MVSMYSVWVQYWLPWTLVFNLIYVQCMGTLLEPRNPGVKPCLRTMHGYSTGAPESGCITLFMYSVWVQYWSPGTKSPKFKRVSLNETPEFPFRGPNIWVDFNLRDSKKRRIWRKPNNIIFHNKNIDIHKTA